LCPCRCCLRYQGRSIGQPARPGRAPPLAGILLVTPETPMVAGRHAGILTSF
jgi:hypothetical protein